MSIPLSAPAIYMIVAGVFVLLAIYSSIRIRTKLHGKRALGLASLPGLLLLCLFYSLALNMYSSLGDWPVSIGNEGFSDQLVRHAELTGLYFALLLYVCTFVWPILFIICLGSQRLRRYVPVATTFAIACYLAFVGILVAPHGFLNWWLD